MGGSSRARSGSEAGLEPGEVLPLVATAFVLLAVAWLLPAAATLTHRGVLPPLNAAEAVLGTVKVPAQGHMSDPRGAYPPPARASMPAGKSWWLAAASPFVLLAAAGFAGWRRLEPLRARALLGRRRYDPRGAQPRDWGRPRDLHALIVRRREPDRFTAGRLDRRLIAADSEAHAAVIAPTRSGKTTRCVIPWLLEHDGPAIVTSTKRDVYDATRAWRARLGRVDLWDPDSTDSACWSPLEGCREWAGALRQALWLADAVDHGDHAAARFWNGEAAKLLAPLLHAAALEGETIEAVIGWLDQQQVEKPVEILEAAGAGPAQRQLSAIAGLDPRNRGTTYMSAAALLAAYRHPAVLATARSGFRPESFLDGGANTLYICSSSRRQRELAPLVVALLSSILEAAGARAAAHGPLSPTLRVLLDEAANIAPLAELPQHLSQAAGHGVRIATVWQSLAQMRERYRDGADSILANSTAKVWMGPITDNATRSYVEQLLGEQLHQERDRHSWRSKAGAQALQQLGDDRALLVSGSSAPAVVRLEPFWASRELSRRHG